MPPGSIGSGVGWGGHEKSEGWWIMGTKTASVEPTEEEKTRSVSEREVVLNIADDEDGWHVYTDSRRFTGRLRKLAARWGVTPDPFGSGCEFILPLKAISFRGPAGHQKRKMSDAQRAAAGDRLRKASQARRAASRKPK